MALSKLSVLNDALANTGNLLIGQAGLDALSPTTPITDENDALFVEDRASRAYERELPLLLERHTWPFARATEPLAIAGEDENPSNRFTNAFYWPPRALWLERVEAPGGLPLDYEIVGRYICMDYDGEDDDAPVASFIATPPNSSISNIFWEVLRGKIEVSLLRSINEDYPEAKRRDDSIEALLLPLVRSRSDQQEPARRGFKSRILERRRSGGGPRAA